MYLGNRIQIYPIIYYIKYNIWNNHIIYMVEKHKQDITTTIINHEIY